MGASFSSSSVESRARNNSSRWFDLQPASMSFQDSPQSWLTQTSFFNTDVSCQEL